jgi:hypothetical protein
LLHVQLRAGFRLGLVGVEGVADLIRPADHGIVGVVELQIGAAAVRLPGVVPEIG